MSTNSASTLMTPERGPGYTARVTISSRADRIAGHGLDLYYREWGKDAADALPVVLLHGLGGSAQDWAPVAQRLAVRRRLIAFDARGHGTSDWARSADYTAEAHFADVATALERLGVARCVLVGYSMGASVAILIAGALPERVERLVVVDSYPSPDMTPGSLRIARWVAAAPGSPAQWRPPGREPRPRFDPAIARSMAAALAAGEPRRADLWPLWDVIACPVLLVRGELSTVLPARLAEEMIARQPHARLVTFEGVGHGIIHSRPLELSVLIEQFSARDLTGDGADIR